MFTDKVNFTASEESKTHKQLLHYTSVDVLNIILNNRTLKCNSLDNVNDLLEKRRNGIEHLTQVYYVSCFCHNPHEIVPFWYLYGASVEKERRVMLRFENFASRMTEAIETDWAFTQGNRIIYFDGRNLFKSHGAGVHYDAVSDDGIERRQTIDAVRMSDVEYLDIENEAFTRSYEEDASLVAESSVIAGVHVYDARTIGRQKTVNWAYEDETRIICRMKPMEKYHDFLLLRLKDEVLRNMVVIVNPWASEDFVNEVKDMIAKCTLPEEIRGTITVQRSELDGLIIKE